MKKVEIIPYQPSWEKLYLEEVSRLKEFLAFLGMHFHHIGSTAVKGCAAKPMIDILGVIDNLSKLDSFHQKFKEMGYEGFGEYGIKSRRYFSKEGVHLHIFEDSNPEVARHLRFVAFLNQNPELQKQYAQLKQALAQKFSLDRDSYQDEKASFIKTIDYLAAQEGAFPGFYPSMGPRKSVWTVEEMTHALHDNLYLLLTYFAHYSPLMQLIIQPDVSLVTSILDGDVYNYVLNAKLNENNTDRRIQEIIQTYQKNKKHFSWWIGQEDAPANLVSRLIQADFHYLEEMIGMYLPLPSSFTFYSLKDIRRVLTPSDMQAFAELLVKMGLPEETIPLYASIPSLLYQEGACYEMYLLYHENKPVSTGVVVFHAHVAGIYYIATLPEYRRRGFATEMMKKLLMRTQERGYCVSTLASTQEGRQLYLNLGYHPCCRFKDYALRT